MGKARGTQHCSPLTAGLTGSAGSTHGQVEASLTPEIATNPVQSKTRARAYRKQLCDTVNRGDTPEGREKGEAVPQQRLSLAAQHFCNFRKSTRRKQTKRGNPPHLRWLTQAAFLATSASVPFFLFFFFFEGTVYRASSALRWGSLQWGSSCSGTGRQNHREISQANPF